MYGNVVSGNNTEKIGLVAVSSLAGAGMKATFLVNANIRDNVFDGNQGAGFWCDLSCENVRARPERGPGQRQARHVLRGVLARADRLPTCSPGTGSSASRSAGPTRSASTTTPWPTTPPRSRSPRTPRPHLDRCNADNCPAPDAVARGGDLGHRRRDPDQQHLLRPVGRRRPRGHASTPTARRRASGSGAAKMIPAGQMDNNGYYRPTTASQVAKWAVPAGNDQAFASLTQLRSTGRESNAHYQEGSEAYFSGTDYRLKSGSPAASAGAPLPADVAEGDRRGRGQEGRPGRACAARPWRRPPPPPTPRRRPPPDADRHTEHRPRRTPPDASSPEPPPRVPLLDSTLRLPRRRRPARAPVLDLLRRPLYVVTHPARATLLTLSRGEAG